jgi:hypothetical protein
MDVRDLTVAEQKTSFVAVFGVGEQSSARKCKGHSKAVRRERRSDFI